MLEEFENFIEKDNTRGFFTSKSLKQIILRGFLQSIITVISWQILKYYPLEKGSLTEICATE